MQMTLNALTSALAQKAPELGVDSKSIESVDELVKIVKPSSTLVAEGSDGTAVAESPKDVPVATTETGTGKDIIVKTNDKKVGELLSRSKGDSKSSNKDAKTKTKTPTKHVKRSSFFGGIFG